MYYDNYYHFDVLINSLSFYRAFQLFFIQACQGDKLDGGMRLIRETTETDSNATHTYSIPVHSDFLIAYSTIPGE
jgi:hypothetical protein